MMDSMARGLLEHLEVSRKAGFYTDALRKIVAERKPLLPEALADALQDRCHDGEKETER